MLNKKTFFTLVLCAGLFMTSCDDKEDSKKDDKFDLEYLNLPYSKLTPAQQKAKLENETIDLLNAFKAVSDLQAIDVLDNFADLIDRHSPPDLAIDRISATNPAQTIVQVSHAYGIYTWSSSANQNRGGWTRSNNNSELRFVFPASGRTGTNNATLTLQATGTGITITDIWWEGYWDYDKDEFIKEERYEEVVHLPTNATGTLSVGTTKVAEIVASVRYKSQTFDYEDFKATGYPESSELKITNPEGYEYSYKVSGTGKEVEVETLLNHNAKKLIEAAFKADIGLSEVFDKIDDVEDFDDLQNVYGKVKTFGYLKMMDNLVVAYQVNDLAGYIDEGANSWEDDYYGWYQSNYFSKQDEDEKKWAENAEKAFNKHMIVSLASPEDGFKIADIVAKAERAGEYRDRVRFLTWNEYWTKYWRNQYSNYNEWAREYAILHGWNSLPGQGRWDWDSTYPEVKLYDYWDVKFYLKFNDNTLVEAETYFSSGFGKLMDSWEDFVDAFNR